MSNDQSFLNKLKQFFKKSQKNWGSTTLPQWQKKSEKNIDLISAVNSRPALHRYFILSSFILVVLYLAPILSHFFQSKSQIPKGLTSVSTIIDFPLDNSNHLGEFVQQLNQLNQTDPFKTDHNQSSDGGDLYKICEDASRTSSLPLSLDSTIVMQDNLKSLAAVQIKSKNKILAFRIGEKIESQARLDGIERLRIIFRNLQNGQCEYIANSYFDPKKQTVKLMDPAEAQNFMNNQDQNVGIKNDGNNFQISKSFMKSKMSDINAILTQAKAIPITNPDGTMSFRIEEVEPSGVFAYLGISNGDVITKINGQPITSYNEVMGMFNQLSNLSSLNLSVLRNGNDTPLQYNFVDQ